jgi:hypothetical protein
MVSWWPGDGNADDIVGDNPGTLVGGAGFGPGMVEEGFVLDGTDDLVVVSDVPELDIVGDVTVDLWAKRTVFGSVQYLLVKGGRIVGPGTDVPTAYGLWFTGADQVSGFFERADGSNVILTGPPVLDSEFHHYAYIRSGDLHLLLMDGIVVALGIFTGAPGSTTGLSLTIGAIVQQDGFDSHFGGVIDEVEVFNRALGVSDIEAIYEAGSVGKCKDGPVSVETTSWGRVKAAYR